MRVVLAPLCLLAFVYAPPAAAQPAFKVAFYNIQSGKGEPPLPGRIAPFVENHNCTDPTQPMNAWGHGLIQQELRARLGADPQVLALGLAEAWFCGSPENVRRALGWAARTSERNGVALVARYGFAGPEQWQQLDTSLNANPADTMWVLRMPVCLDAACSRSVPVYAAHWYGVGLQPLASYDRQAEQTVSFMARDAAVPHVLVGDLNLWEGTTRACFQDPTHGPLARLREAGYVDVWTAVHGSAEGFTSTVNRRGCGVPEGYLWKRIDYAWVRGFTPVAMSRWAMNPPGEFSLSDHVGVLATVAEVTTVETQETREIVLYAADAVSVSGAWRFEADATAAGGKRLRHPNADAPKITTALAQPTDYVELRFAAEAGIPYRLWLRGRADRNDYTNDSVFVQFSGTVTTAGQPALRIGTASATTVVLEEGTNAPMAGWGWQDNGYGYGVLGPELLFASSGPQTIRIQTREDGVALDQVVLSADRYRRVAPGSTLNDTTIVAR